jgi:hypothetical protein
VAAPDSATGLAVMGTLLAADPTGTFFRFTKILQIVNKLYFININYGKRLEAFLAKSAIAFARRPKRKQRSSTWRNYRGKLTKRKSNFEWHIDASNDVQNNLLRAVMAT